MVDVIDRQLVSDRGMTQILGAVVRVGKGDPTEIILSESTVKDIRAQHRKNNNLVLQLSDFDDHITVGFDTKKLPLGKHQGDCVAEHIVVTAQGISGSRTIGVLVIEDGKGERARILICIL